MKIIKREKYIDSDGQKLTKETWNNGDIWYINKENHFHRLDGPAIVYHGGYQSWCKNGQRHRTDGPAIVGFDGKELWYNNGKQHRLDGPAVILSSGKEEYWLEDIEYTKEEYYKMIGKSNQDISITKEEGYITIKIKV